MRELNLVDINNASGGEGSTTGLAWNLVTVAGSAGLAAGEIGAAIGTALVPGPGTAVGAAVGGAAGALVAGVMVIASYFK
jgi:hypothetical protein